MTPKYLTCFRNYRVKNQILIIQLLIFSLIIAFLIAALIVNRVIIESVIEKVSLQLLQNINEKALQQQSTYLQYQTNLTFNQGFNVLNKINLINLLLRQQKNKKLQQIPFSCIDYNTNETQAFQYYLPEFCYYYANNECFSCIPDDKENSDLIFLVETLNQQLLLLNVNQLEPTIYLTSKGDGQFFSIIPQKMRYPQYRPKERQWYIDHMAALEKNNFPQVVSEIYRNYETQEFEFTLTVTLADLNLDFDGVIALDSNFEIIKPKLTYDQLSIYLVDGDGRIFLSNQFPDVNFVNEQKFFNDSSITGFNNDDWVQILSQVLYQNGTSNCLYQYRNFCRFNNLYEQDLFIRGFGIHNRFYQLVFVDYRFMQQNSRDTEYLKTELLNQASQQMIYYVVYNISGIFLCWIIMHFSLKPYQKLTRVFQQTTQSKFSQKYDEALKKVKIFKHNNVMQIGLDNLCHKLTEMRTRKSKEFHFMEKFKYPKNNVKNASKLRLSIKLFPKVISSYNQKSTIAGIWYFKDRILYSILKALKNNKSEYSLF